MRIAINGSHDSSTLATMVDGARRAAGEGFAGYWLGQAFGPDALTALAVAAPAAPAIELGVAVVPIWGRTPQSLAASALTAQAATGGRLTVGIGLSHPSVVEGMWGYRFERTARHAREFLAALLPLLAGEAVDLRGETLRFAGRVDFDAGAPPPSVLLGALGPAMLSVAGERAEGTVIGSAGPRVVEEHIVPTVRAAAEGVGRPRPRVVANVVAIVTDDAAGTREWLRERLGRYSEFPSFRALLEREGVESQADIALVGDEASVEEQARRYERAGVTDLVVADLGRDEEESGRTRELFASMAADAPPAGGAARAERAPVGDGDRGGDP